MSTLFPVFMLFTVLVLSPFAMAQTDSKSGVLLFWEEGFPAEGVPVLTRSQALSFFQPAELVSADELPSRLPNARVLVLANGSAFPETAWPAIATFLQRGGNLVAVGGKPFTRPVFKDAEGHWQIRAETPAYARELHIYDYRPTQGSDGLKFEANSDVVGEPIPAFDWTQSHSLIVRLSEASMDEREGSAGSIDAHLTPLAWGVRGTQKLSAPAVELDHIRNAFVGGRWEFLASDLPPDLWQRPSTRALIHSLVERASRGAQEFTVRPIYATYAAAEPWRFELNWAKPGAGPVAVKIELFVEAQGTKTRRETLSFAPSHMPFEIAFELKPSPAKGLQRVTARLLVNGRTEAVYRTGFWMRDNALLKIGPTVSTDRDFFLINGKLQPIVGTTYMASDVQRQFMEHANPFIWDRDMGEIEHAGLNMLRTGWWTGWDRLTENGVATEKTLRALEAYLLTARSHHLPVQFTFFAFIPEVLGGKNPYIDPAAINAQQRLIASVLDRFHDVPYVMWDLINEPSFSNPKRTWITRPNGDEFELRAWNEWLLKRYRNRAEVANTWRVPAFADAAPIPLPSDADFSARGTMAGASPAAAYDYHIFAQESFVQWARATRTTIRDAGSHQLITIGQDEGGVTDRPMPAFFAPAVDFTTNHTWWLNDALLWDSLAAKQPALPLLVQETGIQHEANLDGTPRMSDEQESWLFERKMATALATGAGAIQWLWNTNAYMRPEMEITIGALRADGTEKPEADVLRRFADFARDQGRLFGEPAAPEVIIVTSQALQFSPNGAFAIEAQQRAVRAVHYDLHISASMLAENQLAQLGSPRLVILPSPQALSEATWNRLLDYVRSGGNLLVTGSVERDEHWALCERLRSLLPGTAVIPLLSHYVTFDSGAETGEIAFDAAHQARLEALTLKGQGFYADLSLGTGHLFVSSFPVELSENTNAIAALYRNVIHKIGIVPSFDAVQLPRSVLVRAAVMPDAVLYLFASEADQVADVEVKDHVTGAELKVSLPSQRARLAIIRRSDQKVFWSAE